MVSSGVFFNCRNLRNIGSFSHWCLYPLSPPCTHSPHPILSFLSSISLPFFHHSLVLFDLFTRVQMSLQRERSGKGLVLSKVWMANTVLAAGGGSTLTLKTFNTQRYTHTRSRTHCCHVHSTSMPLSPEPAAMSSVCMWLWVCVFVCAVFCSFGSSVSTDDWRRCGFPGMTHGLVGHLVKGHWLSGVYSILPSKGSASFFSWGQSLSVVTTNSGILTP